MNSRYLNSVRVEKDLTSNTKSDVNLKEQDAVIKSLL
jgi:hypothetical protein